eukprot:6371031-Ditylum_brightwellii.AAC.1
MPLELRSGGMKIATDKLHDDGSFITSVSNYIQMNIDGLPDWCQHTPSEMIIFMDMQQSNMSIDKIDGMQHQVKPKKKAMPELTAWCLELENGTTGMIECGKK